MIDSSVIAGIVDTVLQIRKKQTEDGDPWAKTITEPADWKILFHDAQPNFQLLKYGECYSSWERGMTTMKKEEESKH